MHKVFNSIEEDSTGLNLGCIEVMENVFIGANSIILPNVGIGKNMIITAGSIVTKDIPDGSVVAGVPPRIIGSFDEVWKKRRLETKSHVGMSKEEITEKLWEDFSVSRKS